MRIYISKFAPDTDATVGSRQVVELIRNLARIALLEKGFDDEQGKDKMRLMLADNQD